MIIRSSPRRSYIALPNSIFRDTRLSLDARTVLAYLLSLPPNWQVRPGAIAKALSPDRGRPLGKERLSRIFKEHQEAGYMARSSEQSHDEAGHFAGYVYIVGADPAAVADEATAQQIDVACSPQPGLPALAKPSLANPPIEKRHKERNHRKRETPPRAPSNDACEAKSGKGTFEEFWAAISGDRGKHGPAMAAWRKLSDADRRAVLALCGPQGLDLDGMWACTWLSGRRWECSPLNPRKAETSPAATILDLKPGSPEWRAERQRLADVGEVAAVRMMDEFSANGRGWSVRNGITAAIDGYIQQLEREKIEAAR